jgi:hypothetical protein
MVYSPNKPDRLIQVLITSRLQDPLVVMLPESDLDRFILAMAKTDGYRIMRSPENLTAKYPVVKRGKR